MAMGRAVAWLNLAYRFGTHVLLRMPGRVLRGSGDAERFRSAVMPEGYVPLMPDERLIMPDAMACISCGLCSLACPAVDTTAASAWDEAWTFVAGPSRSIDRAPLVAAGPMECAGCDACAAVCPTGVPITRIAAMLTRLSTDAESGASLP